MQAHRTAWQVSVGLLAAIGIGVAVISWPIHGLLLLFGVAAVVGGLTANTAAQAEGCGPSLSPRTLTLATCVGCCAVAVVGLGAVLQAFLVPVLMIVAASSPAALGLYRECWPGSRTIHRDNGTSRVATREQTTNKPVSLPAAGSLTDAELCLAWRQSFTLLQRSSTAAARQRIVQTRQAYLDELERRHPGGLHAWLAAGARAAGDPARYLSADWPDPAWLPSSPPMSESP